MTTISTSNLSGSSLAHQDSQDPVHLARTLRRIKRRLLLEQCGVSLPCVLQSTPQVLIRPERRDSSESMIGVRMIKSHSSTGKVPEESEVSPTSPSTE